MAVKYDIYPCAGAMKGKSKFYALPQANRIVNDEEMAEDIGHVTTMEVPDVVGVVSALSREISTRLLDGYKVYIKGLGYFRLSLSGTVVTNRSGEKVLHGGKIKTVKFTPDKELTQNFYKVKLEKANQPWKHSSEVSEAEVEQAIDELLKVKEFFTLKDFAEKLGLQQRTADRRLKKLLESGKLIDKGNIYQHLYARS